MGEDQPEQIFCTAGECLEGAVVVGHATVQVSPLAGAAAHEVRQTFALPLCAHHAYLLRFDNQLIEFDNGTLNRAV